MLFKVTESNDVFKDNPELESIDAFAKCTNRQLKYVFYAYDYKSPLRNMKLEERLEKAARLAGYKNEKDSTRLDKNGRSVISGKVGTVNVAIREFKELQRDEDREILLAIESQISQIIEEMARRGKTIKEIKDVNSFAPSLIQLAQTKKQLIEILDMRDDMHVVETQDDSIIRDDELSTLDILNAEEDD